MRPSTTFTKSPKRKRILLRVLAAAFWLGAWELLSILIGQEILLVSPVRAISALFSLMGAGGFYWAVLRSFGRIMLGFLIAMGSGVLLAGLAFYFPAVAVLLSPLMAAIKATPVASFVILALIWVRSAQLSVVTGFLMVLPIIYTNVLAGLQNADQKLLEMARVFRLGGLKRARAVYLPAAFPFFLSACETSLGLCWKAGIAAEVIGLPNQSIGAALYQAKIFLNTPDLFAWTIAIVLLSVAIERAALSLIKRVRGRLEGGSRHGDHA